MCLNMSFTRVCTSNQEILRISALWFQEGISWEAGREVILGLNALQQSALMF